MSKCQFCEESCGNSYCSYSPPRYTFTSQSKTSKTIIKVETEEVSLTDLLERFEDFLRACGFSFEGYLDFVPEDTPANEDDL